ncbi:MAG: Rdx family protein [Candidatus Desulfatibia sp.]|uniref:SelT/SelW/SelH family protein n=1 Tax=Candidatus Desulfatibia sp. TaxID=3101189 RepID=UPI002F346800
MQLSIEYCITCNYRPMAASLAIVIKKEIGIDTQLVGSKKAGAFEVILDGELIFSKLQSNCFPDHQEIVAELRAVR